METAVSIVWQYLKFFYMVQFILMRQDDMSLTMMTSISLHLVLGATNHKLCVVNGWKTSGATDASHKPTIM